MVMLGASPVNVESAISMGDFSVLIGFSIGDRSVVDAGCIRGDLSLRRRFTVEDLSARPSEPTMFGPALGELTPVPSRLFTASSTGEELLLKILKFGCYRKETINKLDSQK